jgi:hypothetical protein
VHLRDTNAKGGKQIATILHGGMPRRLHLWIAESKVYSKPAYRTPPVRGEDRVHLKDV